MTSFGIETLTNRYSAHGGRASVAIRFSRSRELLSSRGQGCDAVQEGPSVLGGGRLEQLLGFALREAHRVRVPRVELPQVPAGALDAEVVLGALDHPAQLVGDLVGR